jgi:radical SAM protein with 4Fe4S-binding SPASM domain
MGQPYRRVMLQQAAKEGVEAGTIATTNDGKGICFISHIGDIYPSGFLPLTCGNVRSDSLVDVYRDHPVFRELRDPDALKGKCGRCQYRSICGGCRARAYAFTGNYMEAEPRCVYQPDGN